MPCGESGKLPLAAFLLRDGDGSVEEETQRVGSEECGAYIGSDTDTDILNQQGSDLEAAIDRNAVAT